jgi:hypothetical protein
VDLIKSDINPDIVEEGMFDQNVRVYLKQSNRINQRILTTALSEDNHMFWYQNNGVTITCDKYEMSPNKRGPSVKLNNMQIVNGGQTSNCLFEASKKNPDKLDDVLVLLRVLETQSEEIKLSISESTNSQTPINVRDLRANDRMQRQIEDSFNMLGYYYERKARQHSDKLKEKRVDALDCAQAYLAYEKAMPEIAKKDRGRVFGDLYDLVYSEDISAERLLVSYKLMELINSHKKEVRRKIRNDEFVSVEEESLIDGAYHVLYALRLIIDRDEDDPWRIDAASTYVDEAIKIIGDLYQKAETAEINFSSNRYFKSPTTKNSIIRAVS